MCIAEATKEKQQRLLPSASEVMVEIPVDIWIEEITETFEMPELVRLRAVSKSFGAIFSSDDLWLNKLTLLVLQFSHLADVAQGAEESAYDWYKRCHASVADIRALALAHKADARPYLKLYGVVDGNTFSPHAELRFPLPRGLIAELMELKVSGGGSQNGSQHGGTSTALLTDAQGLPPEDLP